MDRLQPQESLPGRQRPYEETLWQMNLESSGIMESELYPERPGEPDCTYYVRTGLCRFGMTCKFNHPPHRNLAVVAAMIKGGYPERIGQPECQYYLKTGTCKFGPTCKFHHPRDKAGIAGKVELNILGYPIRPDEKECAYYMRTGQCNFGSTCKFNHPQSSNTLVSIHGSSLHSPVNSHAPIGLQSYPGSPTNVPLSRSALIAPQWQGSSSYSQIILPQGLVQVGDWDGHAERLRSASSHESNQQTQGVAKRHGTSRQSETSAEIRGSASSYQSGTAPMGLHPLQGENVFPQRPDQPECVFYMKTGDCKFGAICKFHHPRERYTPIPNCTLSSVGLPLRPGEPLCTFYSRYGICKFGPNCKFDHPIASPIGSYAYNHLAYPSADVSVQHLLGGFPSLLVTSQEHAEAGQGNTRTTRRISLSELHSVGSSEENCEADRPYTPKGTQASSFN